MVAQYTAAALLVELRALAHPVSIDTVPTSDNQEDHVSMGMTGALLALECGSSAPKPCSRSRRSARRRRSTWSRAGRETGAAEMHGLVRERVAPLDEDRPPAPDIEAVRAWSSPATSPPLSPATRASGSLGYGRPRRPPAPRSRRPPSASASWPGRPRRSSTRSSSPAFAPSSRTCAPTATQPSCDALERFDGVECTPDQLRVSGSRVRRRARAGRSRRHRGDPTGNREHPRLQRARARGRVVACRDRARAPGRRAGRADRVRRPLRPERQGLLPVRAHAHRDAGRRRRCRGHRRRRSALRRARARCRPGCSGSGERARADRRLPRRTDRPVSPPPPSVPRRSRGSPRSSVRVARR